MCVECFGYREGNSQFVGTEPGGVSQGVGGAPPTPQGPGTAPEIPWTRGWSALKPDGRLRPDH